MRDRMRGQKVRTKPNSTPMISIAVSRGRAFVGSTRRRLRDNDDDDDGNGEDNDDGDGNVDDDDDNDDEFDENGDSVKR